MKKELKPKESLLKGYREEKNEEVSNDDSLHLQTCHVVLMKFVREV